MKGEGAAFSAGFSALGISTSSGAGMMGFAAFMNGLVFLSCSEVAKSRPSPDLKNLSFAGLAVLDESISLNLGRASFEGAGAAGAAAGLSKVPPSLGKAGAAGAAGFASTGLGSGAGVGGVTVVSVSGALKGLNAEIDASNSKSSNSSLNPSLNELAAFFSRLSLLSLSLSATDSVLSPGLNCTKNEESTKSSFLSGLLKPLRLSNLSPADEKQVWDVYAGNARVQR